MKYILFILCLALMSACGKNAGTSSGSDGRQDQEHHGYIDVSSDTNAIPDLLNVTLEAPVQLSGDRIIFLKSLSRSDQGTRHACALSIREQEIWTYSVGGNKMRLEMGNGQMITLNRFSSTGPGAQGVWIWQGQENGMKIIRRFALLDGRMILNQDCEG